MRRKITKGSFEEEKAFFMRFLGKYHPEIAGDELRDRLSDIGAFRERTAFSIMNLIGDRYRFTLSVRGQIYKSIWATCPCGSEYRVSGKVGAGWAYAHFRNKHLMEQA